MPSTISDRLTGVNTSVAIKAPVKAATTADITLSGEQTLDGVALVADDRALVKDQDEEMDNGIYVVKENTWVRAKDFEGSFDVVQGTMVLVNSGGSSAAFAYKVTTADDIVIGQHDITFEAVAVAALGDLDLVLTGLADGDLIAYDQASGDWVNLTAGTSHLIDTGTSGTKIPLLDGANVHSGVNSFTELVKLSTGADVASATALTLGTDGNFFDITGTTAITSIGTLGVGTEVTLQFDGVLTLTHHATDLVLPAGENITTAAGDVAKFYEYATGDWRLSGYTVAAQSVSASALVLLETQTASSDTSIDFTTGIDSTYTSYIIKYYGMYGSSGGAATRLRTSTDGGSTFESNQDYSYAAIGRTSSSSTSTWEDGQADFINIAAACGASTSQLGSGVVQIFNPSSALNTQMVFQTFERDSSNVYRSGAGGGENLNAADVDAIRVYMSTGNIVVGTFELYGVL